MNITFDLRSLAGTKISGVENYCINLMEQLPLVDKKNCYTFFYSAYRSALPTASVFVNSQTIKSLIPNRLLNLLFISKALKIESLVPNTEWLLMPNLNQFSILSKTKLAITVHDLSPIMTPQFYDFKRKLWHSLLDYKKAFSRADVLFAVSEYTKNDLIKIFHVPPRKIQVVYPGIDHELFNPNLPAADLREARNIYNLPSEYILFLNTIEPRKNLPGLISAFENLNTDCNLVIAGKPGWKYSGIFQRISKSKKNDKIRYIGYVEEKHKPAIIKMAKVLAYPSFYEGFGLPVLEAMAVGTPVLTSQLTSCPEVAGEAALYINPYENGSMTWGLNQLLNNKPLASQLTEKGLKQAQKFNWEKTAQQIAKNFI